MNYRVGQGASGGFLRGFADRRRASPWPARRAALLCKHVDPRVNSA